METELKFQVPPARRAALQRAVATASARTTRLQAVYAETAGQHLAAAGLALRLRKEGRVWVQTLKGRGDGLVSRVEHEVPLLPQRGVPQLDLQRHAGTPAGALLAAALPPGAELQPLYRTDIRRLHRRVRHAGAVIEIAYDRGHLYAGERSAVVDEIEFELVSGRPAALAELAQRWAARHGLWWDSRTKSERGSRLALGREQVPAVKAEPPRRDAAATTGTVWAASLQSALAQALPNAAEIASGQGTPEHLHQLRVALRRLRTVLRVMAPWGGQPDAARALQDDWRGVFGQLGALRDADVREETLALRLQAAGAPPFEWPAPDAAASPAEIVVGGEFTALLLRTLALALQPVPPGEEPLRAAAAELLRVSWRRALKDARGFERAAPDEQHRTRKRLKRLRYTLEMLQPSFDGKAARRAAKALRRALEALGDLNDLQSAQAAYREQAGHDAGAWFAVGWLAAQVEPAQAAAARSLARLAKVPPPGRH